ncbi:MAG: hypothetical protein R3C45_20945 [Phycisphaerales bacterium]
MNITEFEQDPEKFAVIRECTENYDVGSSIAEWPNNILSKRTIVYSNGVIAREGDIVAHNVDPIELDRCRILAQEAHRHVEGLEVGMGSGSGDTFSPFFVCNNVEPSPPTSVTEALIRSRFGGTIFPPATITVEPLQATGIWWDEVSEDIASLEEDYPDEAEKYQDGWQNLINWFAQNDELQGPVFVRIGDREALWEAESGNLPDGTELTGCVLPRLAVALTKQGSLVGIFGYSVQS